MAPEVEVAEEVVGQVKVGIPDLVGFLAQFDFESPKKKPVSLAQVSQVSPVLPVWGIAPLSHRIR